MYSFMYGFFWSMFLIFTQLLLVSAIHFKIAYSILLHDCITIFLINCPSDGHLGCFHCGRIMNKTETDTKTVV